MQGSATSPETRLTDDPVFDGLLRQIAAAPVPAHPAPSFALPVEVGAQLGSFKVLEVIGRGGSAVVYRGRDDRLGREVALKVLWRRPDARNCDPLLFEARAIASINDPRIASVYEVGEALGHTFIAMELVRGPSLARYLEGGNLDPRRAGALAIEIALALKSIHDRGLVHRDLKPDNIAVDPTGAIKVLDFGLAKATGSAPSSAAGTPDYMAPEQRRGEPVDARADVYAFGVVLSQLLAECETNRAGRTKNRPGGRALRRLVADCRAELRHRRPSDGAALVRRLEYIRGRQNRAERWARPFAIAVGLAVVGTLGALAVKSGQEAHDRLADPPPVARSVRLTGNTLDRPISSGALSANGQYFAFIDRGLVIGRTAEPDDLRRIELEAPAIHVEVIPGTNEWAAIVPKSDQTAIYRMPADGRAPRRVFSGPFRIAAINPVDDGLILVTGAVLTAVDADGRERWRAVAPPGRHYCAAMWSPDGAKLAVIFSKLERFGRTPCLEVWRADGREVVYHHCSPRLAQAFLPTVFTWGPSGELVFAVANPPGQDRGASVYRQPLDAQGRATTAAQRLARFEHSLAGLGLDTDGRLLTLREEIHLQPMVSRVVGDRLSPPVPLGPSQLDARLSAWVGPDALLQLVYRAGVPRIARVDIATGQQTRPSWPGWSQTWAAVVGESADTLFWYADRPEGEAAPEWHLARTGPDGISPVALPERPREHLAAAATPPTTLIVRCATSSARCVLGMPENEAYAFYRLSLDGAAPTRLFAVGDFHPQLGVWQISPDGSALLVVDRHRTLTTYSLAGAPKRARTIEGLQRVRRMTIAPDSGAVYVSGAAAEHFAILRLDEDREVQVAAHPAVIYLDLLAAPGGRFAYVKKSIDTDLWLTVTD